MESHDVARVAARVARWKARSRDLAGVGFGATTVTGRRGPWVAPAHREQERRDPTRPGLWLGIQTSGTRVLDVATPVLERRQDAEGHLTSRLERPSLPRSVESICARQMSTQRHPVTTEALLDACSSGGGHKLVLPQFERFLRTHPSFTRTSAGAWELGALGLSVVDAAIAP